MHMSRHELIPTVITNVNGVTTTVHKRVDQSSGQASSALLGATPAAKGSFKEKLIKDAVDEVVTEWDRMGGGSASVDELIATIKGSNPAQIRNIVEAVGIARELDENSMNGEGNEGTVKELIAEGAHTSIARVVEQYDSAAYGEPIGLWANESIAKEAVERVDAIDPDLHFYIPGGFGMLATENMSKAADMAIQRDGGGKVESGHMAQFSAFTRFDANPLHAVNYGLHADVIPEAMTPNEFVDTYERVDAWRSFEGDDQLERLDKVGAHLQAADIMKRTTGQSYDNESIMEAVEKFPNNVEDIMAYRRDNLTNNIDPDKFQSYLSNRQQR